MISARYFPSRTAVFEMLADSLRARGIRRISGGIVADESWFDNDYVRAGLGHLRHCAGGTRRRWGRWGSTTTPSTSASSPARASAHARASSASRRAARGRWRTPRAPWPAAARTPSTWSAARRRARCGRTADLPRGTGAGHGVVRGRQPGALHGHRLSRGAGAQGDYRGSRSRPRRLPSGPSRTVASMTPMVEWRSPPLPQAIGPVLMNSQNWFAELLVKTLGKRGARARGAGSAGLAVEREFLTRVVGIDSADFVLRDGSGLSAGNLVTPRALVRLLDYVRRTPRQADRPPRAAALRRAGRLAAQPADGPARAGGGQDRLHRRRGLAERVHHDAGRPRDHLLHHRQQRRPADRADEGGDRRRGAGDRGGGVRVNG